MAGRILTALLARSARSQRLGRRIGSDTCCGRRILWKPKSDL